MASTNFKYRKIGIGEMCMSVCACTCTFQFCPIEETLWGFSTYKNKSFVKTCRHMPLSAAAKLPPPPRRRQAAANLALSRCRHRRCRRPAPPFVGWLLRCCPPSDFVIIAKKRFIVPHRNPNTRAQGNVHVKRCMS